MTTRLKALDYYYSDDLIALGMAADQVRKQFHPEGQVSYSMGATNEMVKTLAFGAQEPVESVVSQLEAVRNAQEQSNRWLAVLPRSGGTGVEHLKILALTRIYLDNVLHVQASWQAGLKLGQVALRFGANDINGAEAGDLRATEEDIRRIIRDAGFVPKQRDELFRTYYLD